MSEHHPVKPVERADRIGAERAIAGEAASREWWRRVPRVVTAPRTVFAALAETDDTDVDARSEPVLAITLLAGMACVMLTPAWGTVMDDSTVDTLVLVVVTFVGGLFYGAAGYFLLGLALWLGAKAVGVETPFKIARQIVKVAQTFAMAHELGMATVLWCYLRNPAFKVGGVDYLVSADLTGQANHLGVTIEADIIKQKLPENNGGYNAISSKENPYGKTDKRIYTELSTDHPIDLCRYQVANGYMGRAGLINSGGASGENDFAEAVKTAVINKRAGGMGLISGRKAFQRPMKDGAALLNAIQDVYLDKAITIA